MDSEADFLEAASQGNLERLQALLRANPSFISSQDAVSEVLLS
jgi:hypothetical protein